MTLKEHKNETVTIATNACDNKKCKQWYGIKGVENLNELFKDEYEITPNGRAYKILNANP